MHARSFFLYFYVTVRALFFSAGKIVIEVCLSSTAKVSIFYNTNNNSDTHCFSSPLKNKLNISFLFHLKVFKRRSLWNSVTHSHRYVLLPRCVSRSPRHAQSPTSPNPHPGASVSSRNVCMSSDCSEPYNTLP